MTERHYISIYFDSDEQKRAFRALAGQHNLSMAELAKRTLFQVHGEHLFLPDPSMIPDVRQESA